MPDKVHKRMSAGAPPAAFGALYAPHPCDAPFGQHPLQASAILPMFPRFAGEGCGDLAGNCRISPRRLKLHLAE